MKRRIFLIILFMGILSLALIGGAGTLSSFNSNFTEGFESGLLTTNNWTTSGPGAAWTIGDNEATPRTGIYNIWVENTAGESIISTGIDTSGHKDINFSFWYTTLDHDVGEYIRADYYNGTAWVNIFDDTAGSQTTYAFVSNVLPIAANDNPDFAIRFRCLTDKNNEDCEIDDISVTGVDLLSIDLIDAYGIDGNGSRITVLNNTAVETIDTMRLNFSVGFDGGTIDSWYLNFSANGTNGCSLGNKQSSVCYSYPNWIQYINGTETATFDGTTNGPIGDFINVERSDGASSSNFSFLIDEHYNPNVFKWYDADFNFSDVKWQNETAYRITGDNEIKVEINESLVPINMDLMKLDLRVGYVGAPDNLEIYACNSTYSNENVHTYGGCSIVTTKSYSELEEDGTKVKGIFTSGLVSPIGDLKYFIIHTEEINASEYYYIKTYKANAPSYTTHWEYSNDAGASWNNSNDSYETELNVNWFYDSLEPTAFVYRFWANTTSGYEDYFEGNITWSIDPAANYPPLVTISHNHDALGVALPHNMSFIASDTNSDVLNVSLYLYKSGVLNYTIVTGLNENDTYYYFNETVPDDLYDFVVEACETATTELYCTNTSIEFRVDNTYPLVNFVSPTTEPGTYSQNFIVANVTASDDYFERIYVYLYNSTGFVDSVTTSNSILFYNFTDLVNTTYYLNATAQDSAGNINQTETRTITLGATDTCTYSGSGNWAVDCNDNCSISSNVDLLGNNITIIGTGTFSATANITNFTDLLIAGTDSTNQCLVYCSGGGCFK